MASREQDYQPPSRNPIDRTWTERKRRGSDSSCMGAGAAHLRSSGFSMSFDYPEECFSGGSRGKDTNVCETINSRLRRSDLDRMVEFDHDTKYEATMLNTAAAKSSSSNSCCF